MITLTSLKCSTYNSNQIYLDWTFETTPEPLAGFEIKVYRSENPGPNLEEYSLVASGLSPENPGYTDLTLQNLAHHNRTWFYKLLVTDINSNETSIQPEKPAYINREAPDNRYVFVRRRKVLALDRAVGRPLFLLKKRSWGQRCEIGWDSVLQGPSGEICDECTCFGTGFIDAYFKAIPMLGMITPNPKVSQIVLFGEFMPSDAILSALDFPTIAPRDIVIDNLNKRWYVKQVRLVEKMGVPLEQICQLALIHPTDELYNLEVPELDARDYEMDKDGNLV